MTPRQLDAGVLRRRLKDFWAVTGTGLVATSICFGAVGALATLWLLSALVRQSALWMNLSNGLLGAGLGAGIAIVYASHVSTRADERKRRSVAFVLYTEQEHNCRQASALLENPYSPVRLQAAMHDAFEAHVDLFTPATIERVLRHRALAREIMDVQRDAEDAKWKSAQIKAQSTPHTALSTSFALPRLRGRPDKALVAAASELEKTRMSITDFE